MSWNSHSPRCAADSPRTLVREQSLESLCCVALTTRQVQLLLEYGYPFPEQQQALRSSRAENGYHHVRLGKYWIEMMIGDLVRSAKKIRSSSLLEEVDELCEVLEVPLKRRQARSQPASKTP